MSLTLTCSASSTGTSSRPRSKSEIRLRRPRPATLAIPFSSKLRVPDVQAWIARKKGELDSDAAAWAQTALEMLHRIRDDVCYHFPDVPHITDIAAVEAFIKSHLPDLPDLTALHDMSARLPDMPHIPDMNQVRSHLPDMPAMLDGVGSAFDDARARFDDVALKFHDLDFERPLNFLPTLSTHLKNLHSHLSSMEFPSMDLGAPTTAILTDLMDSLLSSDLMAEMVHTAEHVIEEGEDMLEKAAQEVAGAVKRSLEGMRLITYNDLPHQWKNNPFVTQDIVNIHTHFIPFVFWLLNLVVLSSGPTHNLDTPELLFMSFALLCLFFSTVWHTMAGCADHKSMDLCARADYVGIGWLISASIGTIVYYGFRCHGQHIGNWYLALCSIGPMVSLSYIHSVKEMHHSFVRPVIPSIMSYVMGLVFYAAHFPNARSHAIWHCFIVLAVSQHRAAIHAMKAGINCAGH
ncbi:hypothetical protein BDQ17DRAFT_1346669 [Cyathus striatus]|nr:hypothetical protein BDQ17DRAFT_1346669 [Cyathus striatus]